MALPGVVAFGEIGLDYSVHAGDWEVQRRVLEHLLTNLREDIGTRPVVVHCRESSLPTEQKALEDLLAILQRTLPKQQAIQVHFFCDTAKVVDRWLAAFPNVHFSVGGMVTQFKLWQVDGVRRIPRGRLLLETDAPYAAVTNAFSTPYTIGVVAKTLAGYFETTAREVMLQTTGNAIRFFQLGPGGAGVQ